MGSPALLASRGERPYRRRMLADEPCLPLDLLHCCLSFDDGSMLLWVWSTYIQLVPVEQDHDLESLCFTRITALQDSVAH